MWVGWLAASVIAGCMAAALAPVTPAQESLAASRWPDMRVGDLARGRELDVRRGSGCHPLVLPAAHGLDRWRTVLDTMAVRARLDSAQREAVWRYLQIAKSAAE